MWPFLDYNAVKCANVKTLGFSPALRTNIRLGCEYKDKHTSLFCCNNCDEDKSSFVSLRPGTNVIKLFASVIYECP